jgi:hypothetical protein
MKRLFPIILSSLIASTAQAASEEQMIKESQQAIKEFAGQLKSELMKGMKSGGPLEAISACKSVAEEIAKSNSKKLGWEISRTSLKPRNSNNAPDSWEATVLEGFEARKTEGKAISKIDHAEIIPNNGQPIFRYMKAIPTKPLCLACHGDNIPIDLSNRLDQLYPDDQARGFKVGDLRGAFSIKRKVQ